MGQAKTIHIPSDVIPPGLSWLLHVCISIRSFSVSDLTYEVFLQQFVTQTLLVRSSANSKLTFFLSASTILDFY